MSHLSLFFMVPFKLLWKKHSGCMRQRRISRLHPESNSSPHFGGQSLPATDVGTAPAETFRTPGAVTGLAVRQKVGPGLHNLAANKKQASTGRIADQPLEALFKQPFIAAHRPPHIPAMRSAPEALQPNESDPLPPCLPGATSTTRRGDSTSGANARAGTDIKQDADSVALSVMSSPPGTLSHREISQFVRERLGDPAAGTGHAAVSTDTAVADRIRTQLRALYKGSLNIKMAERMATARGGLASMTDEERAKINPFRSDNSLLLGSQCRSLGPARHTQWLHSSINSINHDAVACSSVSPMLDPAGTPVQLNEIMAKPTFRGLQPGPVGESISDDEGSGVAAFEDVLETLEEDRATQLPAADNIGKVPARASFRGTLDWMMKRRSTGRVSGTSFMPRRWSLLPV